MQALGANLSEGCSSWLSGTRPQRCSPVMLLLSYPMWLHLLPVPTAMKRRAGLSLCTQAFKKSLAGSSFTLNKWASRRSASKDWDVLTRRPSAVAKQELAVSVSKTHCGSVRRARERRARRAVPAAAAGLASAPCAARARPDLPTHGIGIPENRLGIRPAKLMPAVGPYRAGRHQGAMEPHKLSLVSSANWHGSTVHMILMRRRGRASASNC